MDKVVRLYKTVTTCLQSFLPLSANVDLLLLLLGLKNCVRTKVNPHEFEERQFARWCGMGNYAFEIDTEKYIYIAKNSNLVKELIQQDNSPGSHEIVVGRLLGYPECCCKRVAEVGEQDIDLFENLFVSQTFIGDFRLINPIDYKKGEAFISHIPCTSGCEHSLTIAREVVSFLIANKQVVEFSPWLNKLNTMGFLIQ